MGAARPHAKGVLLDFVTTASAGGATAWESTSTYLRRGRSVDGDAAPGLVVTDPPTSGIEWRLPADLGRTYAAVSGDANPIHLYPLTAKALGFPRQIAHGMWTLARSVAAIENRLPGAVTVEVAFKKPVFLPGTVTFAARQDEPGLDLRPDQPEGRLTAPGRAYDDALSSAVVAQADEALLGHGRHELAGLREDPRERQPPGATGERGELVVEPPLVGPERACGTRSVWSSEAGWSRGEAMWMPCGTSAAPSSVRSLA